MKYFTTFCFTVTVFFVILLSSSCDEKKEVSLHQLISDTHFKVQLPEADFTSDPLTSMGVYLVDYNSSEFSSNLRYKSQQGFYSLADSSGISVDKFDREAKNVDIYAYVPYQKVENSTIEKHHVSVMLNQQDTASYQASDFMCATAERKALATKIDLTFKPQLTKVVINVKKRGLKVVNNDVEVEFVDVATSANINLKTRILTNLGGICTVKPLKQDASDVDFDYTLQAILIPQKIAAGQTILQVQTGGKVYTHQAKYDLSLKPAMEYVYDIYIDDSEISVESESDPKKRGEGRTEGLASISAHTYKIGDYYPMADDALSAIGIVFAAYNNGAHGKILSLDEAIDLKWGPSVEMGAQSKISGSNNKDIIEHRNGSVSQYEAFNWCFSKGKNWYLPAINELVAIHQQKETINRALSPLLRSNYLGDGVYLSSTEGDESTALVLYFASGKRFQQSKSMGYHVRAVSDF